MWLALAACLSAGWACHSRGHEPSGEVRERKSATPGVSSRLGEVAARPTAGAGAGGFTSGADSASPGEGGGAGDGADSAGPPTVRGKLRFVALGDYGRAGPTERRVADLVASFSPDFVVTTGDNNYPAGEQATIDANIGQFFSDFIHPYKGQFGQGAEENRFFPTLGNHDWVTSGAAPYLAYFTLPGNERYYDVVRGDVHFFAIDSDPHEPDGVSADSVQALWLKERLAASAARFQVVAMHHPPFSSGSHGSTPIMQWPYAQWGADLVLAGHDHSYERITRDGISYVVTGLGGVSTYSFGEALPGSRIRYNASYGVTVLDVDPLELRLAFFNVDGERIDSFAIAAR